jgi:hypothetical protein
MTRRKMQFFNLSFLDLMTGALGAIIFLFIITPKGGESAAPVRQAAIYVDTVQMKLYGDLPDSLLKKEAGDTLFAVLLGHKLLPKEKEKFPRILPVPRQKEVPKKEEPVKKEQKEPKKETQASGGAQARSSQTRSQSRRFTAGMRLRCPVRYPSRSAGPVSRTMSTFSFAGATAVYTAETSETG